jgi:hypothetical protein
MPSVHTIYDYYTFVLNDGGGLAPMAIEMEDRLTFSVAGRRFPCLDAAGSRYLWHGTYVRM